MKKNVLKVVSYLLVAVLASLVTMATVTYLDNGDSKLDQLEGLILERFIGEADQAAMEDAAADAMVSALGDRWSYYIPASEYEAYQEQMNNAYVGVGITIQVSENPAGFRIQAVTPGGPAEESVRAQIAEMEAFCAEKRAYFDEMYRIVNDITK